MVRKSIVAQVGQKGTSMRLSKPRFRPVVFSLLLTLAMVSVTAHSPAFATGIESVLFNFNSGDSGVTGFSPHSALIGDAQGNLYGTTANGGASQVGTVFELSPPATNGGAWTETVLYNFGNYTNDARTPWTWGSGLAVDGNGNLYGRPSTAACTPRALRGSCHRLL